VLPFRLSDVSRVEFCKRDELTTHLVCCEVTAAGRIYAAHEDSPDWDRWLAALSMLAGFDPTWRSKVMLPAFAECRTVAFSRR